MAKAPQNIPAMAASQILEETSVAQLGAHIMAIAQSPLFAYQARLAHALGLLAPLVVGRAEDVRQVSDECLSILSADQFPRHRPIQALRRALADRSVTHLENQS